VCQAVRALGVKWTLAACSGAAAVGLVTVSTYTWPVNHSALPVPVAMELLVICMWFS
jgi:hypothetical protein